MDTNTAPTSALTSAPGFTPGRPPEWDVTIFRYGDEIQTALITLGGLLKHLAVCEELKFQSGLTGAPLLPEFRDIDHDSTWQTWAWESAKDDDPEALRDLWLRAVHRSRDAVASASPSRVSTTPPKAG